MVRPGKETCFKSKIEVVEKGVKYVQKPTIKTPERLLMSLLLTLNILHTIL